jgi:hypothetical protein
MKVLWASLFLLAFAGCANVGVVELAPGTYLLSKQDNAGIFGNFQRFKTEVIQEANDFAKSKGKVAIPITMNETSAGPGRFATFQYQFRLVDAADPAAQRVTLTRQPDMILETKSKSTADVTVRRPSQSDDDLFQKLLRLDDLRKRGILTETEFESQKKRLLEQQGN